MINSAQNITKPKKVPLPKSDPPLVLRVMVTVLLMALVFGISIAISLYTKDLNAPQPINFVQCSLAKGSTIQESYPEVCITKTGENFVRELSSEEKKLLEAPVDNSLEVKFCGGIAGLLCPEGYICTLDGNYPDAGGTCTPN